MPIALWERSAIEGLREAAEAFVILRFEDANLVAIHANRVTVMQEDMTLIFLLRERVSGSGAQRPISYALPELQEAGQHTDISDDEFSRIEDSGDLWADVRDDSDALEQAAEGDEDDDEVSQDRLAPMVFHCGLEDIVVHAATEASSTRAPPAKRPKMSVSTIPLIKAQLQRDYKRTVEIIAEYKRIVDERRRHFFSLKQRARPAEDQPKLSQTELGAQIASSIRQLQRQSSQRVTTTPHTPPS
ncbi:hypothetical protein HDU88_000285 [Geranomyces variabilis]|nr:hypothetical protein HDU88_000285 [Geranomyces variabilis]